MFYMRVYNTREGAQVYIGINLRKTHRENGKGQIYELYKIFQTRL